MTKEEKLNKLLDWFWQASPWNKDRIKKDIMGEIMTNFSNLPEKEQKKIISKCAKGSNQDQRKTYYAGLKRKLTEQFVSRFEEKFDHPFAKYNTLQDIKNWLPEELPKLLEAFRKEIQGK